MWQDDDGIAMLANLCQKVHKFGKTVFLTQQEADNKINDLALKSEDYEYEIFFTAVRRLRRGDAFQHCDRRIV